MAERVTAERDDNDYGWTLVYESASAALQSCREQLEETRRELAEVTARLEAKE